MEHSLQNNLKKAFRDIKRGFSEIKISENLFYLKHLSVDDQVDIDSIHDKYFNQAKERGVPTNQETVDRLISEGEWTEKQERKIKEYEDFLNDLINQKKSLFLRSEIERLNRDIEDARKRLFESKNARASLFSKTAESYAEERVNDFYILKCLYKDKELKQNAYNEEEFDDIDYSTLYEIIAEYNQVYKNISDSSIQKIVLQDFYSLYMPFAENSQEFFGKPVCTLSYNQLKLLIYSRFFKNVFSQNDKMPPDIKGDPDKIMDYVNANENAKKAKENDSNSDFQAKSLVGATKEDLEYINVLKPGQKTFSLADEAKKNGGTLDMDQMMKMFGG
jgi:hypothetical protein